ncbi:MAG: MarR family winged helix-turn-helix transcriptional regulator [Candidatus Promineifilaceae bacterium]|nr:MarR family winged helix-turn-helix transcriptional regulator [Candidatus Promineifilaceae bacterium]
MIRTRTLDKKRSEKWDEFLRALDSDIDPGTFRLMGKMHGVAHMLYQAREAKLAEAGLSYARFRLLLNLLISEELDGKGEMNPSEISLKQGISRNTVSALIRDLEATGLIERHLDCDDRRRFNICLTLDGRNLVREHAGAHFRFIDSCFAEMNDDQQRELEELLDNLAINIERSIQCK